MEDLATLAKTLAEGIGDARGSLILSRDGLVLGAHPEEAESLLKPAWLQMAALGEPERGFVQFGPEIWCYVRRGPYAAFVIVGPEVRPGIVIERIEQALLAAEESRTRRETVRAQEGASAPIGTPTTKPRTPLHPEAHEADRPVVLPEDPPLDPAPSTGAAAPPEDEVPPMPPPATSPDAPGGPAPDAADEGASGGAWIEASEDDGADEEEVDRFSLAREFSQLLQEDSDRADG